MDVDYPALLAMFQEEAGENLASMEEALVGLEHAPDDDERLNTLFRAAHTIKGNADSLGLRPLAELAHALEDLLELFRGRRLPVTRERIDVLLESVDALRGLLAQAEGPTEAAAPAELLARLEAAAAGGERRVSRKKAKILPSEARASAPAAQEPGAGAQLRTQRVAVFAWDRRLYSACAIARGPGGLECPARRHARPGRFRVEAVGLLDRSRIAAALRRAMSFLARFPPGSGFEISVLATDLSTRALEQASSFVYPLEKSQEIPEAYRKAFMLRGTGPQAGRMKVAPAVRDVVRYERLNLNGAGFDLRERFDLVLCRNVLIYFDTAAKQRVVSRLVERLDPEGYLFVGHAETLTGLAARLVAAGPTVYRSR